MNDGTETHPLASQRAHWAIVASVTAIGAVWLAHTGPVPVIRITTPLEENAPFWYMVSPFPILGMLVAEFVASITSSDTRRRSIELASALAVLVVVSHFRLVLRLPLSGHSFLLSYFVLRRVFPNDMPVRSRRAELWIAVGMFIVMLYLKLTWWSDPITLSVGTIAGAALFWGSRITAGTQTARLRMESAQPSPPAYPEGRADAPSGSAEA